MTHELSLLPTTKGALRLQEMSLRPKGQGISPGRSRASYPTAGMRTATPPNSQDI